MAKESSTQAVGPQAKSGKSGVGIKIQGGDMVLDLEVEGPVQSAPTAPPPAGQHGCRSRVRVRCMRGPCPQNPIIVLPSCELQAIMYDSGRDHL